MKLSTGSSRRFALLLLCCTTALANNWFNETYQEVKNDTENGFDEAKELFEKAISHELAKGLADLSIPGVLAQFPMDYDRTPPISASPKTSYVHSEVTVALWDEEGEYAKPETFSSFSDRYAGWDDSWFGIALDSLDAEVEVQVDLSKSADKDYTLSLLKLPFSFDGGTVEVDFQIYITAKASAEMSFTAGFELSLKSPAALMMPALDPTINLTQSQIMGLDIQNFDLKPIFNASMPQLDFTAMLALRTVFSVSFEGYDIGALTLDLPAFDLNVNTMQNMLADCTTPPPGTPADKIYAELINVNAGISANLSYEVLNDKFNGTIDSWTLWSAPQECYAFFPGSGSIGVPPPSSKDSVLTEKPLTTCTTDGKVSVGSIVNSLSPGIKAAVAVGTVIGVSLIAAMGFCLGRASQRHDIRKHGVESINAESNYVGGGFLHRRDRTRSEKDGYSSRLPVRQVDDDAEEAQMQRSSHRIWPKRKPVPFIMVEDASVPSSADLPAGSDNSRSPANVQEPSIAWNGNQLETSRYWGPGDVAIEGQGLLQEQNRQARRQ